MLTATGCFHDSNVEIPDSAEQVVKDVYNDLGHPISTELGHFDPVTASAAEKKQGIAVGI